MENQRKTIIVESKKSMGVAVILAVLFGPLGLFYSSITGGIVMLIVNLIVGVLTFGIGLPFTWPICGVWAYFATKKYNENLINQ